LFPDAAGSVEKTLQHSVKKYQ